MNADVIAQLKHVVLVARAKRELCHDDFWTLTMALHDHAAQEGVLVEVRAAEEAIEASIRATARG